MTTSDEAPGTGLAVPGAATPPAANGSGPQLLTADAILAAPDLPTEDVPVPEWGGVVRVRGLTGEQRDAYYSAQAIMGKNGQMIGRDTGNASARLLALCLVDAAGALLFTPQQIDALGAKSAAAIERVFEVATRLSGLTDEDVDEAEKNSALAASAGSTTT